MKRIYTLRVWGDFACFTRPEWKVERVSYEMITPSACRGIFEAIFWRPSLEWKIIQISLLKPVQWVNLRRNELGARALTSKPLFIEEERVQRSCLMLKDVEYLIQAELTAPHESLFKQWGKMFERRASKGQCIYQPYLGCREFSAYFELVSEKDHVPIPQTKDLGWMLHDINYETDSTPYFFSAFMKEGTVKIPSKFLTQGQNR